MKAMDLISLALLEHLRGNPAELSFTDAAGLCEPVDLRYYFREPQQFNGAEQLAITLARGDILDVGCATGYHVQSLSRQGNVVGIDVGVHLQSIWKEKGLTVCSLCSMFDLPPDPKYDTILLLGSLGAAGSVEALALLLTRLNRCLRRSGQILVSLGPVGHPDYIVTEFVPTLNGFKGEPFRWISVSSPFLATVVSEQGLHANLLTPMSERQLLVRISS